MPKNLIISPISIDLGAKNTGVYFAHYSAGSSLEDIEKEGKVYQLEKDKYTLMMVRRTALRHQRRGYKRRQMVKRLFRLIWCEEFGLEWNDDIQQTVSFLLNRRGFSYLTNEFDAEILEQFPEQAFCELPKDIRNEIGNASRVNEALSNWKLQGSTFVKALFTAVNREPKETKRRLKVIRHAIKLKTYCEERIEGVRIEENPKSNPKLSKLPKWILDTWKIEGIMGLSAIEDNGNEIDITSYLNQIEPENAKTILKSIPDERFNKEKAELRSSIWNFYATNFDFKKANFDQEFVKNHIHHFVFALYKINDELTSGARHRSRYFEEINNVLTREDHTHAYLRYFCTILQSGEYKPHTQACLTPGTLTNLIGHLSNLELKPLRKYFNGTQHKNGDCWDKEHLNKLFGRWLLNEWRVNLDKDLDKAEGAKGDYISLRKKWESHKDDVVDFWLQENPYLTIPPYQDNNNRRPPKCQSLVLNPIFLDREYTNWQTWVSQLTALQNVKDYLGDYQTNLETLESGKRTPYFSHKLTGNLQSDSGRRTCKDMDARILQFILDRVKDGDPLILNEIYSRTKKHRQSQSTSKEKETARKNLENSIEHSELPDTLKSIRHYQDNGVFAKGSFLHLVCNYYKFRQNARDGRVFIHPEYRKVQGRGYEKSGRFDDGGHLLTYCNHTPRQKRYQIFSDFAGLFNILPQQVEEKTEAQSDVQLVEWLGGKFKGLKTNCENAAKEQKKRRGRLKEDIQIAYADQNADRKLHDLVIKAQGLCRKLGEKLHHQSKHEDWNQAIDHYPATAVYLLARINDIAFKERSGKARTCAVCSSDNAQRMQIYDDSVKAQRLAAISTRLIDGAVMRLARILGQAIVNDKWKRIESDLNANSAVRVPIITESNRFEFEPSLEKLKTGREPDTNSMTEEMLSKSDRIKGAAGNISPYSGADVGGDGDSDHIIPRSHPKWGTLNDEANLIYTSLEDNRYTKGAHKHFTLSSLHDNYKNTVFNKIDNSEIAEWIKAEIWNEEKEDFTFGRYLSFVNLTPDQQKAFRHALFLTDGCPLREAVIDAINHRTKTLVNGTQRYFAEVLANELYKKAKAIKKHHLLSFDYFGVEAQDNSRGDGIYDFRSWLEKNRTDLQCYAKENSVSQKPYSHLLDAQIAFCVIAESHQDDGGLRIKLGDAGIRPREDRTTGELKVENSRRCNAQLFDAIQVKPHQMRPVKVLNRRRPNQRNFNHRSIHRDTIYTEHYLSILVRSKTAKVRIGFDWNNSFEFKESNPNREKLYFALQFNPKTKDMMLTRNDSFEELVKKLSQIGMNRESEYFCISLNKRMVHAYYIENYNAAKGYQDYDNGMKFLRDKLAYRTERKNFATLDEVEKILKNEEILENEEKTQNKKLSFRLPKSQSNLVLPVKKEWEKLVSKWKEKPAKIEDSIFLSSYFNIKESNNKQPHEKFRKVFSLPIKTNEGKILLKRKSWNGKPIFQIVNDSDSHGAKTFIPAIDENGRQTKLLSESANSSNIFLLNNDKYYLDGVHEINPENWYKVKLSEKEEEHGIVSLSYRIPDNTRPDVCVKFSKKSNVQIAVLLEKLPDNNPKVDSKNHILQLLNPRYRSKDTNGEKKTNMLKSFQEKLDQGEPLEYKGAAFSAAINKKLSEVF